MKERTCCFSGHRDITEKDYGKIKKILYGTVEGLIADGFKFFGCGGALGFDTLAAQTVIELKLKYPYIKLIMIYPCKNQTIFWNKEDKKIYNEIKEKADKCVYISESYDKKCMAKRNRHMVEHSSCCVCYLKRDKGDTAYTADYAEKRGCVVINIAETTKTRHT